MKIIYFKSDAYNKVFSSNNAHKFTVSIQNDLLNYQQPGCLHNKSLIYVAVKSISFKVLKRPQTSKVLALRSDLKTEHTCFNSQYESIVSTFLLDAGEAEREHFVSCQYNPIFVPSSVEKLKTCSFSLCNLEDETDTLSYIDKSTTPTIVEVWVKSRKELRDSMQPFHIFIKSSDVESKKIFPQNTKTDFKFQLAEHKHLSGKWVILLRDLIVSRKFFNIPDDSSFKMKYIQFDYTNISNTDGTVDGYHNIISQEVVISAGYYGDEETFVKHVSGFLHTISQKQIKIIYNNQTNKCRIDMANVDKTRLKRKHLLHMSKSLAIALGFAQETEEEVTPDIVKLELQPQKDEFLQSDHEMRIFHRHPKQVLLNCNIIEPSLFGSKMTRILHLIPNNKSGKDNSIMNISFPEHSYKDLAVHSFGHIRFWFEDENGETLQMDEGANSTYITLSFVKLT